METPHAGRAARRLKRLEEAPNLRGANRYLLLLVLLTVDIVLLFVVPGDEWGTLIVAPFVAATLMIGLLPPMPVRARRAWALLPAWPSWCSPSYRSS